MTFYSPKKVAEAIGVSEASLKRWCDKGLLQFNKTAGGHRRIPHSEVMNFLREGNHSLENPEVLGLPKHLSLTSLQSPDMNELIDLIHRGDEEGLRQAIIGDYLRGKPLQEIHDLLLAPLFREIGHCWSQGRLEIYQERFACETSQRLLYELSGMISHPPSGAPLALGGTLSGDPYSLPSIMAETILRHHGWRGKSLGIDLTGLTLAKAIEDYQPRLLWLSVSSVADEPRFIEDWTLLWKTCERHQTLLVTGGRALTQDLRARLNYHCYCDNMTDLANFVTAMNV